MSLRSLEDVIPAGDLVLLDTSTIMSYFKGNELASPVAAHLIDRWVAAGRNPSVVSTVTAMELLVPPLRDQNEVLVRSVDFFLRHTRHLRIADMTFTIAQEAAMIRAHYGLKTPDALIVGTGRALAVRHVVSNDRAWSRKRNTSPRKRLGCDEFTALCRVYTDPFLVGVWPVPPVYECPKT